METRGVPALVEREVIGAPTGVTELEVEDPFSTMEGEPATTLLVVPEHFERVAAQEVEQQPSLTWEDSDTGPATALVVDWTGTSYAEVWHDGEVV